MRLYYVYNAVNHTEIPHNRMWNSEKLNDRAFSEHLRPAFPDRQEKVLHLRDMDNRLVLSL